ncbi:MAG: hypothetical protein J1E35_08340 [Lachnospiraceae bacterium]|nr:hypothetical protein [Lachnospiraceae bacterium]
MLRKIWNTLRYGEKRTKSFLISVMVLILAVIGCVAAAIVTRSPLFWVASVALALITAVVTKDAALVVIKDNAAIEAVGEDVIKAEIAKQKRLKRQKKEEEKERKAADKKELSEKKPKEKNSREKEVPKEPREAETSEKELPEKEPREKKPRKKKTREEEAAEQAEADEEDFGEDALANMTEVKLKKLLVRYKVKQEHIPVIIDLCVSEHVKQTPGFAWISGGSLKILLIESKPRLIERPCGEFQVLEVERGIAVRASHEYTELRKTDLMSRVFTPYLPRYHKKALGGRTVLLKNLYILGGDMKFSSGSVNGLRKLLPLRIEMKDRKVQEREVSAYYKELFLTSFLWQDGILTLEDYQKEVEQVLESMALADISYNEFDTNLSEMINAGLLPAEYRKFAYAKREQGKTEKEDKRGGKKSKKKEK